MAAINYENRKFCSVANSPTGEVGSETIFYYHQNGDVVWAKYSGGEIVFGTLIAKCSKDGSLDMRYQHLNTKGALMTGICRSKPETLPDGRIRLREKWQRTCGDHSSGESVIEELPG
ncbi:MAG: n-acetylglutamate synthase [Blastocatellia bacterium]